LLKITTRHTSGEEAVGATFTLVEAGMTAGRDRIAPTNVIARGAKKGAKGGKKAQKHRLRRLTAVTNDDNVREEIKNYDEEFMASVECDFKQLSRPPKDHFEEDS
jgi:hypothetical protein